MFCSTQRRRRQLRGIRRWCNHACSRHHSNQREGIYCCCCCGCPDGRSSPLSLSLPLCVCIEWWQPLAFSLLVYTHYDDVTLGYFLFSLSSHLPLWSLLACYCSDLTTNACRGSISFLFLFCQYHTHTHVQTHTNRDEWIVELHERRTGVFFFLLLLLLRLDVRSFRHTNTQARTSRRPVPFFSSSVRQRGERMHLFPFSFLLLGHSLSLLFLIGSNESAMTRIVDSVRARGRKEKEMQWFQAQL